jgi:hypothetical protein
MLGVMGASLRTIPSSLSRLEAGDVIVTRSARGDKFCGFPLSGRGCASTTHRRANRQTYFHNGAVFADIDGRSASISDLVKLCRCGLSLGSHFAMNTEPEFIPKSEYETLIERISLPDSPVGIDAQYTHAIIITYLQQIAKRLDQIETKLSKR